MRLAYVKKTLINRNYDLITDYLITFEIGKQFIMLLALENSNSPQSMLLIKKIISHPSSK